MTLVLNAQGEICVFTKTGGAPISVDDIMKLVRVASKQVANTEKLMKTALDRNVNTTT